MKKRKIKLLASLTSLVLVVAVMAVGVWAATSHTLTVNSTASFTATGIAGNVKLIISDQGETGMVKSAKTDTVDYATAQEIASFTKAQTTQTLTKNIAVVLEDNGDGIVEANSTITYTFTITNDSTNTKLGYTVTQPEDNTDFHAATLKDANLSGEIDFSGNATVVVVFTLQNDIVDTGNWTIPTIVFAFSNVVA